MESKEKVVAHLANFAYDPYNYTSLRQLNILELFLDCLTEPSAKLVEFGAGGICNACVVLDGIGKGLDPRFDITEIAKPYAMELLRFREAGFEVLVKDLRKRWEPQANALQNLFRQADRVEKLAETIQRLEQADLKLRVWTLESERAFQRVAAVQKTVGNVQEQLYC